MLELRPKINQIEFELAQDTKENELKLAGFRKLGVFRRFLLKAPLNATIYSTSSFPSSFLAGKLCDWKEAQIDIDEVKRNSITWLYYVDGKLDRVTIVHTDESKPDESSPSLMLVGTFLNKLKAVYGRPELEKNPNGEKWLWSDNDSVVIVEWDEVGPHFTLTWAYVSEKLWHKLNKP